MIVLESDQEYLTHVLSKKEGKLVKHHKNVKDLGYPNGFLGIYYSIRNQVVEV